ncbi:hypothetical protein ACSLBF_02385 [Pseudoalteromonas sp. T1lg65]|uniref:hypothetical protein n=1 Tax=Pseudoalteromonas sp. T1lg65 TaxID=2077101 RepID=UPI003F7A7B70
MKLISILISAALASTPLIGNTKDLQPMKREVKIFERVLGSALQHDMPGQVRKVSGYYLQGQGLVFELQLKRQHSLNWLAPLDNLDEIAALGEFDFPHFETNVVNEENTETFSEAWSSTMEKVREEAEKLKESAWRERETRMQLRELKRQKSELEFAKRHHAEDDEARDDLAKEIASVEQNIESLNQQESELGKKLQQLRNKFEQQKQQKEAQKLEQQRNLNASLSDNIARSLCDYGAGLKALAVSEYISFTYPNLLEPEQKHIMIYQQSEVQRCVTGKIDASALAKQAKQYVF